MSELIKAIGRYQQQKGLTDQQLSRVVGLNPSTLCKVKGGSRAMGLGALQAIARIPELRELVINYTFPVSDKDACPGAHPPQRAGLLGQVAEKVKGAFHRPR